MLEPAATNQAALEKELGERLPGAKLPPPGAPSLWTKFAYGFGSIAYGIKDQGFKYFLLIFYAQVVGLDARLVSTAILIALIADAFSDPIVGYWSDNFRSKWGRRHPFMYAAALPIVFSYFFLWTPPDGWSQQALFWYVVALSILIRTLITFYETPSAALAAELTGDYDERSSLLSWRYYFGWSGGNIMTVVSFLLIFPAFATAAIPNGQFNPESYRVYALIACGIILVAILVSSLGTHARIKELPQAPPKRHLTLGTIFREMIHTFSSRSFGALFAASLLGYVASGLGAGLAFYFSTFFWGFSPQQIGIITAGVFVSAIIGSMLAPIASRTLGKKRGAIIIGLVAFIGSPLPIFLRLLGVMPENGDPILFPIILAATVIDVGADHLLPDPRRLNDRRPGGGGGAEDAPPIGGAVLRCGHLHAQMGRRAGHRGRRLRAVLGRPCNRRPAGPGARRYADPPRHGVHPLLSRTLPCDDRLHQLLPARSLRA